MPAPSEEYRWDDAILKARKDAQDLLPTKDTLVGSPRLGSGHPINVGLTTGSKGTEHTATRLRGGLEADPSNVARAHFEEGDWATKLATGDKLPGEYVFGDTVVKSPKILQVGIDHPTAGQGFYATDGEKKYFIPYSHLSESVETQGQRMERERVEKEIAASKDAENKMMVEWARGVLGPGSNRDDWDEGDIKEAQKWFVNDAEYYARNHGKHKHVEGDDIYKAGAIDRDVAIDNAVGVDEIQLGPDLTVEIYYHEGGGTEPYIVDTREGEPRYLALEGHPEYHKLGASG